MKAMNYELFIRKAFEDANGKIPNRSEDPAGFADTDVYTVRNLAAIKCAVGYAIGIYSQKKKIGIDATDRYLEQVLSTASLDEISEIIEHFSGEFLR